MCVGLLVVLAGCSAGFDATSSKPYSPADGVQADSGDLRVLNALVVVGDDGSTGTVSAAVVNRGDRDDRLTGVTSPGATILLTGSGDLAAGGAVTLGSGTDPSATATGLRKGAGQSITMTFSFTRSEPITIRTVVVAATGIYTDLAPSASPPPSP